MIEVDVNGLVLAYLVVTVAFAAVWWAAVCRALEATRPPGGETVWRSLLEEIAAESDEYFGVKLEESGRVPPGGEFRSGSSPLRENQGEP